MKENDFTPKINQNYRKLGKIILRRQSVFYINDNTDNLRGNQCPCRAQRKIIYQQWRQLLFNNKDNFKSTIPTMINKDDPKIVQN